MSRDGQRRSGGFTLMEILVVLVIIGIVLSAATIAVGVLGRDREMEDEGRRFWAVLRQAREEAELQSLDIGVFVSQTSYEYLRFDRRQNLWVPIVGDRLFAPRELPEGLRLRLWLESREVILEPGPVQREAGGSEQDDASAQADPAETDRDGEDFPPQIMVLSSGDTMPFELQIERDGAPALWRVVAMADNDLRVERRDEQVGQGQWQIVAQTKRVEDELQAANDERR